MFGRKKHFDIDGRNKSATERAVFYGINGQKFIQTSPGVAINPDYRPNTANGDLPLIYDPKVLDRLQIDLDSESDIGRIACLFTDEVSNDNAGIPEII